jgi:long-chain acyl-CoA synthetase
MRSGLYITAINHQLAPDEVTYIVNDSSAAALIVSHAKRELAVVAAKDAPHARLKLVFDGAVEGFQSYETAIAAASAEPFAEQPHGATMLYSSGTTGRPKGVRPPLPQVEISATTDPVVGLAGKFFGVDAATRYLSPAPIYHAAPMRWCGAIHAHGGTVVMMRKFDAETSVRLISEQRITHAQFVPTMFVRMLQLPEAVRSRYNIASLRVALHAAAPCPVEVKQRMIDWWGQVLVEYYAGTEANGLTMIDSKTWLTKPGSVGRAILGVVHVCDDEGRELAAGEIGNIYLERDHIPFTYHNDPAKTKAAQHPEHPTWSTLGDIGYLDGDGFVFLTDRKSFMIISGGVNIYPQEIENVLALHPAIHDVAVIGLPDPEMGEVVTAFVQPAKGATAGPSLEREIIEFVRSKIAKFKAPKAVRFVDALPRTDTGKLVKGELKKKYALPPR